MCIWILYVPALCFYSSYRIYQPLLYLAVLNNKTMIFFQILFSINQVSPKVKKALQLLRLRQINNGVFVRLHKSTINMLRLVEPYIAWGWVDKFVALKISKYVQQWWHIFWMKFCDCWPIVWLKLNFCIIRFFNSFKIPWYFHEKF